MLEVVKVVSPQEMSRIEKLVCGSEPQYMDAAGKAVSEIVIKYITKRQLSQTVTLLIGKGNNGGDAYVAGIYLLDKGYQVRAISLYGNVSPLNQMYKEKFIEKQGKIGINLEGLIVDGLLGTGFAGQLDGKIGSWIQKANDSGYPIIAIDIPSGLNGTTGKVEQVAIVANETVTMGLPKMGLFLRDGWNHVGKLHVADFGLPKESVEAAHALAYLPKHLDLPKIVRNRHKYQAGYVVGLGGSKAMAGSVKLTGLAALKAGAGIVRIFKREEIGPVANELISSDWNVKAWKEALTKARAVFVGPGIGRSKKMGKWLKTHLKNITQHCVLDADALLPNLTFPKMAVLTPHRGELLRLLDLEASPNEEDLFAQVIRFCTRNEVVLVLKGGPTFVFAPHRGPIIVPYGDPGMATAGAGDVLTGIIAALLAQGCSALEGAVLGAVLHGLSGELAAKEKTSYCLTATDLIEFLPKAFQSLMKSDIVETTQ